MRIRTMACVVLVPFLMALSACTASQQYRRAAHRFEWTGACWVPSNVMHLAGDCGRENGPLVQSCIRSLSEASTARPPLADAMQNLETCMADEGFKPVVAIPFHPAPPPSCGDDYPFERCPVTERDTSIR